MQEKTTKKKELTIGIKPTYISGAKYIQQGQDARSAGVFINTH